MAFTEPPNMRQSETKRHGTPILFGAMLYATVPDLIRAQAGPMYASRTAWRRAP